MRTGPRRRGIRVVKVWPQPQDQHEMTAFIQACGLSAGFKKRGMTKLRIRFLWTKEC